MRVRMKVGLTGTRNGVEWPPKGGEIDLPIPEAEQMLRAGLAEPLNTFEETDAQAQTREALVPRRTMKL